MKTETLCPIHQHPELAGHDETELHRFANTLRVELLRNWDGRAATSSADAWRIRAHFDAERIRAAEADNARRAQAEADDAARLAPLTRRIEQNNRRTALMEAIDTEVPFADERYRDWDARATERGDALFAAVEPAPEIDTRTPLERLRDKGVPA